jgi:hypothetical protein
MGADVSHLRVARRVDDRNARTELSCTPGQRKAIQQPGQKNVSDQKVKRHPLLQQGKRVVAADRGPRQIALSPKSSGESVQQGLVVINKKNL